MRRLFFLLLLLTGCNSEEQLGVSNLGSELTSGNERADGFFRKGLLKEGIDSFVNPAPCISPEIHNDSIENPLFYPPTKSLNPPAELVRCLRTLEVSYINTEGKEKKGVLVVHSKVQAKIKALFAFLKQRRFPFHNVGTANDYDWDDNKLMSQNITSAYNFRYVANTNRLSAHAAGCAIDINPLINPYYSKNGETSPSHIPFRYDTNEPGTITATLAKQILQVLGKGWRWGGDFKSIKDLHHFEYVPCLDKVRSGSFCNF